MKTLGTSFLTAICAVWLCSCGDACPPDSEHEFHLTISSENPLKLKKIEAVGAIDTSFTYKYNFGDYQGKFLAMDLPLSLRSDSVTYIFDFEIRIDTLTVFYKRDFEREEECGFVMKVAQPKSQSQRSTFREVDVYFNGSSSSYYGGWPVSIKVDARL